MKKGLNQTLQTVLLAIIALTVIAGLGLSYYFGEQALANQEAFQCGQNYRYTVTQEEGTSVSYPMVEEYKKCIESK